MDVRKGLFAGGIILLIIGLFFALALLQDYNICSSGIGVLGQALSPSAASACAQDEGVFALGVILAVVGLILTIVGAATGGGGAKGQVMAPVGSQPATAGQAASTSNTDEKFCQKCGTKMAKSASFCPSCGAGQT